MADIRFVPLTSYPPCSPGELSERAATFRAHMEQRRSVRRFATTSVPRSVIEDCLRAAGSAPSGANKQPWHFVAVSDAAMKKKIRQAAEKEECEFYHERAGDAWLEDLSCLGTKPEKPFLEQAPFLIAVFAQSGGISASGQKEKHYYVSQSVGIATGLLLAAIHAAGLASLPYTPSRMGFLRDLLGRGRHERPFLLLVVGYPAEGVTVPKLEKKSLDQYATFM